MSPSTGQAGGAVGRYEAVDRGYTGVMILELNGQGGVGKYTVGRIVAEALGGRLIDNHTIYNPAFATTEFASPAFLEMVLAVRGLVFEQAALLPPEVPIVLTVAAGRNLDWGREWQATIRALADRRSVRLLGVQMDCDLPENARRLGTPTRALMRKMTDAAKLDDGVERPVLLDHCDAVMRLDVSDLSAEEAARRILTWIGSPEEQP